MKTFVLLILSIFFISCDSVNGGFPKRFLLIDKALSSWDSNNLPLTLLPNDAIHGDSILNQVSTGFLMETRAGAEFTLSIAYNGTDVPELNLFLWEDDIVRTDATVIPGTVKGDFVEYQWTETQKEAQLYIAVLSSGNDLLKSAISSIEYTGEGSQVTSLGINIHFVGVEERFGTANLRDALAQEVLTSMSEIYEQGGLSVSEVKIVNGEQHPKYGDKIALMEDLYFDQSQWQIRSGDFAIDLDSMSYGLPSSITGNLDVVVVPFISGTGIIGIAPFFGASLEKGWKSVVVVGASTDVGFQYEENSDSVIVNTLAHEIGHFLGLRHTSSTIADMESSADYSITHDGISDTPFDAQCQKSLGKMVNLQSFCSSKFVYSQGKVAEYKVTKLNKSLSTCPDATNLMYATVVDGVEQTVFTPMQGDYAGKNLGLLSK